MVLASILVVLAISIGLVVLGRVRRARTQRLIAEHTITPEELHALREGTGGPRLFDVRLPLDVLAYSESIPGSVRITPREIEANPLLIPKDEDTVVYCTCPGDETSKIVLERVKQLNYNRIRLLRGGLAAWKDKGYPVERIETAFRLDTPA